jgi:hypothetical protein
LPLIPFRRSVLLLQGGSICPSGNGMRAARRATAPRLSTFGRHYLLVDLFEFFFRNQSLVVFADLLDVV